MAEKAAAAAEKQAQEDVLNAGEGEDRAKVGRIYSILRFQKDIP